jgi:Cu-processing system permease protein
MAAFLVVVAISLAITAVFLSLATLLAQVHTGRRSRALARALIVWFVAVVLYDVAVLGIASLLRSGTASRLLITAALVNPVDAARTVAFMAVEGTSAFGAASLALFRFTGGPAAAALLASTSLAVWAVAPLLIAGRRLARADV